MLTLVVFAVVAAVVRFFLDGVTITVVGQSITLTHQDPLAYGSLLAPILGAHGFINTRPNTINPIRDGSAQEIDNPDA